MKFCNTADCHSLQGSDLALSTNGKKKKNHQQIFKKGDFKVRPDVVLELPEGLKDGNGL